MYRAAGAIGEQELLTTRLFGSRLEGHPSPLRPWVDAATGSLGFGLPVGVGVGRAGKLEQRDFRVWVLCGDSELAEGSVWEAFEHAAFWRLDNLTAIVDVNRLGQSGPTMHGWNLDAYLARARAFGWHAIAVDGHDVRAIDDTYAQAVATRGRPTVIVAKTVKGKGVAAVEDRPGWHGKTLDDPEAAIAELGGTRRICVLVGKPPLPAPTVVPVAAEVELPRYELGREVATRRAYGEALSALGAARGDVVAMDGEVSNSTFSGLFAAAYPERYLEMYVAEQQMVAAAVGLQVRGWKPFASAFAAFWSRAYDFVRMAALSEADIRLTGSHAGVATGEDGPSQMALEDLAALRAVRGSTVLYPCDANQTAALVALMADLQGVVYLRTTRAATPVIYPAGERFPIGGSRLVRFSDEDDVAIVAAGITVHEALQAAELLAGEGIDARVLDAYSVKPIDQEGIRAAVEACHGRVVTVEDHRPEGGLGEAVLSALADSARAQQVRQLAVRGRPGSGSAAELLAAAGIDAAAIADAARSLVAGRRFRAVS
jgi:transketolase